MPKRLLKRSAWALIDEHTLAIDFRESSINSQFVAHEVNKAYEYMKRTLDENVDTNKWVPILIVDAKKNKIIDYSEVP